MTTTPKSDIEATIKVRGSRYGNYRKNIVARAKIMKILRDNNQSQGVEEMTPEFDAAFSDIVLKLVRASVSPSYADSFHDIAGFSTLTERELCNNEK